MNERLAAILAAHGRAWARDHGEQAWLAEYERAYPRPAGSLALRTVSA